MGSNPKNLDLNPQAGLKLRSLEIKRCFCNDDLQIVRTQLIIVIVLQLPLQLSHSDG